MKFEIHFEFRVSLRKYQDLNFWDATIIIMTSSTNRNTPALTTKCFVEHEEALFQTNTCILCKQMLRCVRKEGKVFFAFDSKDTNFVHSKAIRTWMKGKNILQGIDKYTQY
jgi:hypothetical protein